MNDLKQQHSLVGDIGGTNARFGLVDSGSVRPHSIRQYRCEDFVSLPEAIDAYLSDLYRVRITNAAIAVATPIVGDTIRLTNNHWVFSRQALQQKFGFTTLHFVNDFSVQALAIPHLQTTELVSVGDGVRQTGEPLAVLGPGTGLGVSGLVFNDGSSSSPIVIDGEGGHVSLAARSAREFNVIAHLQTRFGHVSAERFLSGPGLTLIHDALRAIDGLPELEMAPAQISMAALEESDAHCVETLQLFCEQLGSVAGDLALVLGARGGVFIGGGIVPKLGDYFYQSGFRRSFENKGRMSSYVKDIPTSVILAENPGLIGAATLVC